MRSTRARGALRILAIPVLIAVLGTLTVGAAAARPSGDGPGNSPNAQLCQKGGWMDLVREGGSPFGSVGACVAYAAMGGTPMPPGPTLQEQWEAECVAGDGRVDTTEPLEAWQCGEATALLSQATFDAMAPICTAAGGEPGGFSTGSSWVDITCDFF